MLQLSTEVLNSFKLLKFVITFAISENAGTRLAMNAAT